MNSEQPPKAQRFEKITSFLIVAFVVGSAIVVPGLIWAVRQYGDQLPAPIQKLAVTLGISEDSAATGDDSDSR